MEENFFAAVYDGKVEQMETLLKENPAVDVNWHYKDSTGWTPLHAACYKGHDAALGVLVAHGAIKINEKTSTGDTPFLLACFEGKASCTRMLIKDPRTLLNEPDKFGHTSLKWLAHFGHDDLIADWIASGRGLDLGKEGDRFSDPFNAAKSATQDKQARVKNLLEKYKKDPARTRQQLAKEKGLVDNQAGELFVSIILICEEYFAVKAGSKNAARFLRIVSQLPMELQMIQCRLVFGFSGGNITGQQIETAYQQLVVLLY